MQKLISLFLLALFTISIFAISNCFVNPTTPTFYISNGVCYILAILLILKRYKQWSIRLLFTEVLLGSIFLYATVYYGVSYKIINFDGIVTGILLMALFIVAKRINLCIEWLYIGFVIIGIVQSIYGIGQYLYWLGNIAAPSLS